MWISNDCGYCHKPMMQEGDSWYCKRCDVYKRPNGKYKTGNSVRKQRDTWKHVNDSDKVKSGGPLPYCILKWKKPQIIIDQDFHEWWYWWRKQQNEVLD